VPTCLGGQVYEQRTAIKGGNTVGACGQGRGEKEFAGGGLAKPETVEKGASQEKRKAWG